MVVIIVFLIILSVPLWGFWLVNNFHKNAAAAGWIITVLLNTVIYFFISAPPLLMMLLYISATFLSLKIVVASNQLAKTGRLNFIQWCLFCYAWFGMNPAPFTAYPAKPLPNYITYFTKGLSRIAIGIVLINGVAFISPLIAGTPFAFITDVLYLVSLSLILHFGVLNISAGFLRSLGISVTALFKDPIKSKTLNEFWSKRWNMAFVELTTIAVLRPVKKRYGVAIAFWVSFIFSGLLHELAISLPVRSGYGKPFAYFIIQAVLILGVEKKLLVYKPGNFIMKCWLLACLFLPIFLLFHEAFILQVVLPLVGFFTIIH